MRVILKLNSNKRSPKCPAVQEPSLADFWQTNFKVQVEAQSGLLVIHHEEERPVKRRKRLSPILEDDGPVEPEAQGVEFGGGFEPDMGMMDFEDGTYVPERRTP